MKFKENKNVIYFIIGLAILLFLIFVTIPPAQSSMGIYLFGLIISFLIYNTSTLQRSLVGLTFTGIRLGRSLLYGVGIGILFFLATALIPGLSIGIPLLPSSISDSIKFFVIVFVAPIAETIIFQGAIFGFFRGLLSKKNLWIAIVLQAFIMSIAHISAYLTGFYAYPNFTAGMSAILANISSFFAVFLFACLAGYFVSRDGIRNLLMVMVLHGILNSIIYTKTFTIVGFFFIIETFKYTNIHTNIDKMKGGILK